MTQDDAKFIISLMLRTDDGCYECAGNLIRPFIYRFPEYKELGIELYKNEFDMDLYR